MRCSHAWLAAAALACVALAAADEALAAGGSSPAPRDPAAARPLPLKEALARGRFTLEGWLEVAATTSPLTEASTLETRGFTAEAEGVILHQACLALERTLREGRSLDVGGKVSMWIGEDARLVHARGLLDDQTGDVQVDLFEAWGSLRLPVARGLTIQLGKIATPLGYELTEAPSNHLVSHTVIFENALPFTHVGGLATLTLSPRASLAYGLVLGWDVWDDPNDALTHLATASFTSASGRDGLALGASLGAERPDDDDDLRWIVDGTWTHRFSTCFETALNGHVGGEAGAAPDGSDARWFGVAAYLTWQARARVAVPLRVEVFRDEDGARLGQPATLLGLTLGADWTIWESASTLRLRPEVRYDRSLDGAFYDGGVDEDQLSLTLDLVLTF